MEKNIMTVEKAKKKRCVQINVQIRPKGGKCDPTSCMFWQFKEVDKNERQLGHCREC